MGWVYLDDRFPEHPKIEAAGGDAGWLFVCALAYTNRRNAFDGVVPKAVVARLSDRKAPAKLAARLVAVGLWEDEGGDFYRIHDYEMWNEEAMKRRASAKRAANARWSRSPDDASAYAADAAPHMPNGIHGNASAYAAEPPPQCLSPVPSQRRKSKSPLLDVNADRPQNGQKRDRSSEKPNGETSPDSDLDRLVAVCVGHSRKAVHGEALAVIGWARQHVDESIIDEAIGWYERAADEPRLPRVVAGLIHEKAGDHNIAMPTFTPIGKVVDDVR